jgi:hypothetical protein
MNASLASFVGRLFAVAIVFWKFESESVMMCPGPVPRVEKFKRPLRFVLCPASALGFTANRNAPCSKNTEGAIAE